MFKFKIKPIKHSHLNKCFVVSSALDLYYRIYRVDLQQQRLKIVGFDGDDKSKIRSTFTCCVEDYEKNINLGIFISIPESEIPEIIRNYKP